MKRKFFLGTGAAILVVAAAFASKAKFAPVGIYYTTGTTCHPLDNSAPLTVLTTVAPGSVTNPVTAKIVTANGGQLKLYVTSVCHNVTYILP
jgi:hypothetical protein